MAWINEGIGLSVAGGVGAQLLSLVELPNIAKEQRPDFRDITYYFPWIINVGFSWLIGYAYFHHLKDVNNLLAIHIGASAPLLFKSLASTVPKSI